MTNVIVVCAVALVALSTTFALGLSRAAACVDDRMREELALMRLRARTRGMSHAPPPPS